jgi:hypothetical protein
MTSLDDQRSRSRGAGIHPQILRRFYAWAATRKQASSFRSRVVAWLLTGHLPGVLIVVVTTSLFVTAFYINQPDPRASPDTPSYLFVAEQIREHGQLTDVFRTPGYPLFISLIFFLFGNGNLLAVSIAQGVLFVVTAIEIYAITYLIARRVWIATTVALVASVNTYQVSYAKGVIVEGFALWTVVSLALVVVLFFRSPRARELWLVAGALLLALMTRPEWLYAAVPLFVFMLLGTHRLGVARRRLALHACAAVAILYSLIGVYVYANGAKYSYGPFVVIPRIVLLGKVMQYRMQDDAPPRYAGVTRRIDAYLAKEGDRGPYLFVDQNPDVGADYWRLAGEYARATVRNDPVEYVWKTVNFAHTGTTYRWPFGEIDLTGTFGHELSYLETVSAKVYEKYTYFPLFAGACLLLWIVALVRSTPYARRIQMMAALAFLGLYQLFVVTAGGYADWPRLFSTLNPLRVIVIFGSALVVVAFIARLTEEWAVPVLSRWGKLVWWTWLTALAALPLALIASPLTARLGPFAWSTSAWFKVHPLRALALLGFCAWVTLLASRARQAAASRASAASPIVERY